MPQESPTNGNHQSKQRFNGRRRNYVDAFRWGFVPEEASDHSASNNPAANNTESRRTDSVRDMKQPDAHETSHPDSDTAQRKRPRKKSAKITAAGSETIQGETKPDRPSRQEIPPRAKTRESGVMKHSPQTSDGQSAQRSAHKKLPRESVSGQQTMPEKSPPKGSRRKKAVVPPYVSQSAYVAGKDYDADEDLKLPSYGRTPIPSDDELPRPQKTVRKPEYRKPEQASKPVSVPAKSAVSVVVPEAPVTGFHPRREQMVWDPDKSEYVLLVDAPKAEPNQRRPAAKSSDSSKPVKQRERTERSEAPLKKPEKALPERLPKRSVSETRSPLAASDESGTPAAKRQTQKTSPRPVKPKPEGQLPEEQTQEKNGRSDARRGAESAKESKEQQRLQRDSRRNAIPRYVEPPHPDPTDVEAEVSGFAELGVSETMLEALKIVRYLEPTPIQAGVFQKVQAGVDLMGQAQTGTGKTAAFSMPIIEGVETCPPGNDPVALILVPTRELAVQVRDEAVRLAYGRDLRITACYGGKPLAKQIERLKSGIDILVGTPGRILDLMNRRALFLHALRWVVLDEADRMLDIGFRPDIEKILRQTPQERQTLLFSATLPPPVVRLAEKYMKTPEVLDFSNKGVAVETIEQFYVTVDPDRKFDALVYLLQEQQPRQAIIFTRTKRGADRLARLLSSRFDRLAAIHGDLAQSERDRVMSQVRAGSLQYLVATDVVGRGIDVSGISHIINYDVPKFCDDYIHRVGRTGRMGREGVAFTFVTAQEGSELTRIEMRIDKLLQRAELKGFESFTKPHDPDASLEEESPPEPAKPVFGKPVRKVRRAL